MSNEDLQRALNFAYFYLKFRPRSRKEIIDYLTKKAIRFGWTRNTVEAAVARLEETDIVNDDAFVKWFVESRGVRQRKSVFMMKRELVRFGVDKSVIDGYFDQNTVDEVDQAAQILASRLGRFAKLGKRERFQKAAAFLARRGYSYQIIKQAVAKIEGK